jgi:hypothetical protein
MSTTFATSAFQGLDKFQTPEFKLEDFGEWEYQDADDELLHIAKFIKGHTGHNSHIEPERIKFLYTRKPKKDGGRFVAGSLILIDSMVKMINDTYDYMVVVYHPVWKKLDSKNKVIQLDKILCGIDMSPGKDMAEVVYKKKQTDSKEYTNNMRHFGFNDVLKSSEMIDLATQSAIEKELEEKKNSKKKEKKDANSLDEDAA